MTPSVLTAAAGTSDSKSSWRIAAAIVLAALFSVLSLMFVTQPAHAAATITIEPAPSSESETVVKVSGSGFQYLPNAPGGIYVFFGLVSDPTSNSWAPSQGGLSGVNYSYSNLEGSILLVGFEGEGASDEMVAVIDANGNWEAEMTLPPSSFMLSSGNPRTGSSAEGELVDCLVETCGFITIGAMGNQNANNESFTPVAYAVAEEATEEGDSGDAADAGSASEGDDAGESDDSAAEATTTDAVDGDSIEESGGPDVVMIALIAGGGLVVIGLIAWIIAASRRSKKSAQSGTEASATNDSTETTEN